jgi:hypothetical protein
MKYDDLRKKTIEDYLNEVEAIYQVANKDDVQSILAPVARCVVAVTDSVVQLSASMERAQFVMGTRISELTVELNGARTELNKASVIASEQTAGNGALD